MEPREVLKDRRPHCSEPFLKMGGSSGGRPLSPFQSEKGSQIQTLQDRTHAGHAPQLSEFIGTLYK